MWNTYFPITVLKEKKHCEHTSPQSLYSDGSKTKFLCVEQTHVLGKMWPAQMWGEQSRVWLNINVTYFLIETLGFKGPGSGKGLGIPYLRIRKSFHFQLCSVEPTVKHGWARAWDRDANSPGVWPAQQDGPCTPGLRWTRGSALPPRAAEPSHRRWWPSSSLLADWPCSTGGKEPRLDAPAGQLCG